MNIKKEGRRPKSLEGLPGISSICRSTNIRVARTFLYPENDIHIRRTGDQVVPQFRLRLESKGLSHLFLRLSSSSCRHKPVYPVYRNVPATPDTRARTRFPILFFLWSHTSVSPSTSILRAKQRQAIFSSHSFPLTLFPRHFPLLQSTRRRRRRVGTSVHRRTGKREGQQATKNT